MKTDKKQVGASMAIKIDMDETIEALVGVSNDVSRLVAILMASGEKDGAEGKVARESADSLKRIAGLLESQIEGVLSLASKASGETLLGDIKQTLNSTVEAIREIEIKAPEVKFDDLTAIISKLEQSIASLSNEPVVDRLSRIETILLKMAKLMEAPVKVNSDQWRELTGTLKGISGSGGGGGISLGGNLPTSLSAIGDSRVAISVTNTAVALSATSKKSRYVFITAAPTNADLVVIGGSTVVFTEATRTGKIMYPGDSITLEIDDVSKIYVNGTADDAVTYTFTK